MTEALFDALIAVNVEAMYLIIALGLLRPLGLLFGFVAFSWGLGNSTTLRASIAFAIGIPLMIANAPVASTLAADASTFELAILAPKEFALGYGLGFLASLPFLALQYAGAITDSYRGESDSGIQDPAGGSLQTYSVFYLVIGFFVFVSMGGMWQLISMLYDSFLVWPIDRLYPALTEGAGRGVLRLLDDTLKQAAIIALPLLICLMAIEFVIIVSAKLGKKFGTYDLVFLSKNFAAILCLPLIAILIQRSSVALTPDALDALPIFETLLK